MWVRISLKRDFLCESRCYSACELNTAAAFSRISANVQDRLVRVERGRQSALEDGLGESVLIVSLKEL